MYRTQSAVTISAVTAETVSRDTEEKPEPFFSVLDSFVVYYYISLLLTIEECNNTCSGRKV